MYIEECSQENKSYFQPEGIFLKKESSQTCIYWEAVISTCKYQQYKNNQEWNKKLDGALSNLIFWEELLHLADGLDLVDF